MVNPAIVGYVAGFCTTVSFIPQVLRSLQRRSCRDLSWTWLFIFMSGLVLWLTYGILLNDWPMIIANSLTMCLCFSLIWIKIRYKTDAAS